MNRIDREVGKFSQWDSTKQIAALKRILPRANVEEVLTQCGQENRHCRRLPKGFMVWFVLGLGLFGRDAYRQVCRWLRPFGKDGVPGRSTVCEARQRIGLRPFRLLSARIVRLLARPETPGAFYAGMRLMALDGFVLDLPDTPANERVFGRPGSGRAPGAFPQARVLALCETGSHAFWKWSVKSIHIGEPTMAPCLLRHLQKEMLLLWDRGFFSYATLQQVRKRQAQLLARVKKDLIFTPLSRLADGSYLAAAYPSASCRKRDVRGIVVRIIEYVLDDSAQPGGGEVHRLLTTLLDATAHPAEKLVVLYHERWEEELTIDELKTHERERPVLRSQTPRGVLQEIEGLLLLHYAVRKTMFEAAALRKLDPRKLSFTGALKILRCRLAECPRSAAGVRRWHQNLLWEIGEERLEPRRNRRNPRVIKKKLSPWPKKKAEHYHYLQPAKEFTQTIRILN